MVDHADSLVPARLPASEPPSDELRDAPREYEQRLGDALERFALARHAISAREGTLVSAYREPAVELIAAHNAIIALFAAVAYRPAFALAALRAEVERLALPWHQVHALAWAIRYLREGGPPPSPEQIKWASEGVAALSAPPAEGPG